MSGTQSPGRFPLEHVYSSEIIHPAVTNRAILQSPELLRLRCYQICQSLNLRMAWAIFLGKKLQLGTQRSTYKTEMKSCSFLTKKRLWVFTNAMQVAP